MIQNRFIVALLAALCLAGAWVATTSSARADVPGEHPRYIHALSDLRHARWLLNHPEEWTSIREESEAVARIDSAIGQITQAAINDGKDLNEEFPSDRGLDQRLRVERARDLLESARDNLSYVETNGAAMEWRDSALQEVREALHHVDHAISMRHWEHSGD